MIALRLKTTLLAATLDVSLLGVGAGEAAAVKPAAGVYSAEPAKPSGIYQLGVFAVATDGGKRRIVPAESYDGIYYPDLGRCDSYEVPLAASSIPITAKGRFEVRDRKSVRKGTIRVAWKGAWVKPRRVRGTLRISYGDCRSKIAWRARRAKVTPRPREGAATLRD